MATDITMPQMGSDMIEGTVVKWLKSEGDAVERGEIIAEIETDKANVELEAYEAGTLIKIVVAEGETVPVGETIAMLGESGEVAEERERKPAAEPASRKPETVEAGARSRELRRTELEAADDAEGTRIRISPVARRIALEHEFDYRSLKGSGPGGRILRKDIEAAIDGSGDKAAPAADEDGKAEPDRPSRKAEEAPIEGLSRIRKTIARRMTQSKQEQPHYYLTIDVDMTDAMAFRAQLNEGVEDDQRATVNDLIVKACALAILEHPKFNASFSEDGLRRPEQINIDVGVALEEGLIAVSILDVAHKSLGTIAIEAKEVIGRARENRLKPEQYGSGTFTITNLGGYGVETLIGIINPPQAAILGVGTIMEQPVVRDGEIVVRQVMKIALSADHRVTDGAEGARFIKTIQELLEAPAKLAR